MALPSYHCLGHRVAVGVVPPSAGGYHLTFVSTDFWATVQLKKNCQTNLHGWPVAGNQALGKGQIRHPGWAYQPRAVWEKQTFRSGGAALRRRSPSAAQPWRRSPGDAALVAQPLRSLFKLVSALGVSWRVCTPLAVRPCVPSGRARVCVSCVRVRFFCFFFLAVRLFPPPLACLVCLSRQRLQAGWRSSSSAHNQESSYQAFML